MSLSAPEECRDPCGITLAFLARKLQEYSANAAVKYPVRMIKI
jgi:hypothetical protein